MRSLGALDPCYCAADWNAKHPAKWHLSEADFAVQMTDALLLPQFTGQCDDGFVISKLSPQGRLFEGTQTQTLMLTALTAPSLLPEIQFAAKEAGFTRITLGSDENHLTPGVIKDEFDLTHETRRIMEELGWQKSPTLQTDLENDLQGFELPGFCSDALRLSDTSIRVCTQDDELELEAFLQATFPGRWTHDVMKKFRSGEAHQIDVLISQDEIVGFSMTQDPTSKTPIGGARWRAALGAHWGALGPIGVSQKVRGKKLGHALLGSSLLRLSQEGARNTIIDWTTLIDFYGVHGFLPTRVYESYSWTA